MDLGPALRALLLGSPEIVELLGFWEDHPSIHTRRPVPESAGYPMIVISGVVAAGQQDGLTSDRPNQVRDIIAYGQQPVQYRDVERLGVLVRQRLHDMIGPLLLGEDAEYRLVNRTVTGPTVAPVSDERLLGRRVELQVQLSRVMNGG